MDQENPMWAQTQGERSSDLIRARLWAKGSGSGHSWRRGLAWSPRVDPLGHQWPVCFHHHRCQHCDSEFDHSHGYCLSLPYDCQFHASRTPDAIFPRMAGAISWNSCLRWVTGQCVPGSRDIPCPSGWNAQEELPGGPSWDKAGKGQALCKNRLFQAGPSVRDETDMCL